MARVPFVEAVEGESPPELVELYRDIAGLRGRVVHLYKALANQPDALRAFMGMSRYIRDDADFPADLRELAILATGYAVGAAYEIHHHVPAARRAGVSEAKIAALPDWAASDAFTETERAVIAYADQVARTRDADDATFAAIQRLLPPGQMIDLALTCGWYHLVAAVLGPLRIEIDSE